MAVNRIAQCIEAVDEPLFDTIYLWRPPFQRVHFFSVPVGMMTQTNAGTSRVKDYLDTNVYQPGMLDSSQEFVIRALRCAFVGPGVWPLVSCFYADTLLRLVINRKTYWTGPAWKCADPVTMMIKPDALLSMGRHKMVDLTRALRRKLDPSPVIPRQGLFSVEATFSGDSWKNPIGVPERMVVLLEGKFLRPVM